MARTVGRALLAIAAKTQSIRRRLVVLLFRRTSSIGPDIGFRRIRGPPRQRNVGKQTLLIDRQGACRHTQACESCLSFSGRACLNATLARIVLTPRLATRVRGNPASHPVFAMTSPFLYPVLPIFATKPRTAHTVHHHIVVATPLTSPFMPSTSRCSEHSSPSLPPSPQVQFLP